MDWQKTLSNLVDKLVGWAESVVLQLPNLVLALLIVILFWIASRLLARGLRHVLEKTPAPRQIRTLTVRLAAIVLFTTGLFVALSVLNLDKTVTSLLAGAGILGLALGFAFQDMAANFMAGVYFAFARPIHVGDIIETNSYFGTVERVDLRSLILRLPEGQIVLLPNKEVFEKPLVNYSSTGRRRVDLPVGVSYGDDLQKAKRLAMAAVEALPGRDKARPVELFYTEFGDSSINFVVRFWIDFRKQADYLAALSDAIVSIKRAFDEADITIPFPIRTLDFGIVGGEKLSEMLPPRLKGGGAGGE